MATLLASPTICPSAGGLPFAASWRDTATFGRGQGWGSSGAATCQACKNTFLGFRQANYSNANYVRRSVMFGFDVNQGFGNYGACNGGFNNTSAGAKAGYDIRAGSNPYACGSNNTQIGDHAGFQTQFGYGLLASGTFASFSQGNRTGRNIALGKLSIRGYGTTGKDNIAIGCSAYHAASNSCNKNIMIGIRAGRYAQYRREAIHIGFGSSCGGGTSNNCGLSIGACAFTSGCCSVVIGKGASGGYGVYPNKIAITTNCNPWYWCRHTILGNANNSAAYVWDRWTNVSDCRDKTNIQPLSPNLGLPFIEKLRPVKFNWDKRDKYVQKCGFEFGQKDGTLIEEQEHYGFIAQEIETALNELNVSFEALGKHKAQQDENIDVYDLRYLDLVSPMVQSLKDLIEDLEATEARLEVLKA